jgi:hypothetical protein
VAKARKRRPAPAPVIQKTSRYTKPNPPAPKRRAYSPPASSRSDAAQGPPTKAERKAAERVQRKTAKRVQRRARRKYFPKNAVKGVQRSERRALKAFADLKASRPEWYARKEREARDVKVLGVNVEKAARDANEALLKGAESLKRRIDKNTASQRKLSGIDTGRAGKEILDIVANAPTSAYMAGDAAVSAAKGDSRKAKKLWQDFKDTSAVSAAVSGNLKEAAKRTAERPITTALELSGAKALVGRTGGAVARKGAVPGPKGFRTKVKSAGSTERPNLRLYPDRIDREVPGGGPRERRDYSRDIINKGVQVALEKRARRKGRDPNVARHSNRRFEQSGAVDRGTATSKLRRRGDTRVFSQDRVGTRRKAQAETEVRAILRDAEKQVPRKYRKHVGGLVQLVAEGTVRTDRIRADLNKRKGQLAKARKDLKDPERLRLNRAEAKHVRELLALTDEQLARMVAAAQEVGRQQAGVQARGRQVGTWDETGMAKRNYPALQSHVRRPKGEQRAKLTPEEIRVAAKKIQQRHAKGKEIPSGALMAALEAEARFAERFPDRMVTKSKTVVREEPAPRPTGPARPYTYEVSRGATASQWAVIRRGPDGTGYESSRHRSRDAAEKAAAKRRAGDEIVAIMRARGVSADDASKLYRDGERVLVDPDAAAAPRRVATTTTTKELPRSSKPGEPKPVRREDFVPFLEGVRRRQAVPARRLDPDELESTSRVLQRRARQGKSTLSGLIEGGPAFITQRPGRGLTGTRLQAGAPFEPTRTRSGRALDEGSREVGEQAIQRQAVTAEAAVTAAEGFQLLDREFGIPARSDGRRYADSRNDALERARELTLDPETGELLPDALPLVPVNIAQFQTFGARLRAKQEQGMPRSYAAINDLERQALKDSWDAALAESGRGKWVLMPEDLVQRLYDHASVRNWGPLHSLTNHFKDVVLTSSSPARWIGGNITDLSMRTLFAGITPLDVVRGREVVRRAAKQGLQGEQAAAAVSGGGLYHAADALNRSTRPRGMSENPARTVLAAPWRAWKGTVYAIEHAIEELPQFGAVGKAMRQETGRSIAVRMRNGDAQMKRDIKSLLKLHDQQIDNFANTLARDRAVEARLQAMTEDVIGRWGKISPAMRRALVIAPFAQWLGAATRYTFLTLPGKHPIKTGILAGVSEMTEKERAALGLSYFAPRSKQVYDYQMGSIPTKIGKNEYGPVVEGVRTSRMTSFGTAAGVPGNIGGFLLPQFAGALDAWAGTSFTEEQLVYPDWWPDVEQRRLPIPPDERYKIGMGALLEASVPFLSAGRRAIVEKGAPAEPWSTVLSPATRKKWDKDEEKFTESQGTMLGGILEWLTPFAPEQRLYQHETGKAIEEQGITGETLERWSTQPKRAKGFGFGGGSSAPATKDFGFGNRGLREEESASKGGYGF